MILICLALGSVAGFFAGLLGVGGGAIMVPVLTILFADISPQYHVHLALGTSLATIIFTSLSSVRAHHAHGAVLWPIVRDLAPGIVLGTFLMSNWTTHFPKQFLAVFFATFISWVALRMLKNLKPQAHHTSRQVPGRFALWAVGALIGAISALVAIGGGSLTVPFLTWCNIDMRKAIATSSAVGFPIAVAGSLGYLFGGYGNAGLPSGAFGFIYLPALFALGVSSMLFAPLGARAAHRLPVPLVKKVFAFVLLALAANMLYRLYK